MRLVHASPHSRPDEDLGVVTRAEEGGREDVSEEGAEEGSDLEEGGEEGGEEGETIRCVGVAVQII